MATTRNYNLPALSNEGGLSVYLAQIKKFPMLDAEEEYFSEEDKYGFEEPEILESKSEDVHEAEGYAFETAIKAPTTVHDNWLKQNLSRKLELRKLMVLRDVLGEPRSIKPYSGDYFQ